MSKAILMSIQPKWCELIISGEKTIEVRKTRPKLEAPFKVYIYCTKPKMITRYVFRPEDYPEYMRPDKTVFCKIPDASSPYCSMVNGNSKVIGEFVCDLIEETTYRIQTPEDATGWQDCYYGYDYDFVSKEEHCLSSKEIYDYGSKKPLFGWHISDLVIYEKPKELSELHVPCDSKCDGMCYEGVSCCRVITRPPQSWCYVEEVSG